MPVDEQFERRRTAVTVLVRSVLDHLAAQEAQPRIGRMIDIRRWWRYGQEDFVGLQPRAWSMPAEAPIVGWLDKFPAMTAVRHAYDADSVQRARVDTLIGTEFNRQRRNFNWLLVEHIVQPMVLTTGTYGFDEALFDRLYDGFERGFGAQQIHIVEFLPLNGFESTETVVLLPDGLVLRRMSDRLMSAAIDHLAVPRMSPSMPSARPCGWAPGLRSATWPATTSRPSTPRPTDTPSTCWPAPQRPSWPWSSGTGDGAPATRPPAAKPPPQQTTRVPERRRPGEAARAAS